MKIFIKIYYRIKRLFTYTYILNKRAAKFMTEISKIRKGEEKSNNMMTILKKIISNEKLILPRLKVFESIVPFATD